MSHKLVSLYIGEGEYYTRTDADNVLAEKDAEITQLQAMLEERNKQVAELKSDIADLRDDKKLTDAILDERNAEIAELKEELAVATGDCQALAGKLEGFEKETR